jgi:hypothetical protein
MEKIVRQPQVGYVPDWKASYVGSDPGHRAGLHRGGRLQASDRENLEHQESISAKEDFH